METEILRQITEDQINDGRLSNYLGKPHDFQIWYNEGSIHSGKFLICSDGLYRRPGHRRIAAYVNALTHKNIRPALEEMAQCAIDLGETDNITLAVVICKK